VLSWVSIPVSAGYAAAESAEWSVTNALRVSYPATDMAANVPGPKADPGEVARATLVGAEAGLHEVLADEVGKQVQVVTCPTRSTTSYRPPAARCTDP